MTKKQKVLISLFIKLRRSGNATDLGGKLDTESQTPVCTPPTPSPVASFQVVEEKQCEKTSLKVISKMSQT